MKKQMVKLKQEKDKMQQIDLMIHLKKEKYFYYQQKQVVKV